MRKYILKEQKIKSEYKYVFLCGTYYDKKNKNDKRKILRNYLEENDDEIKAIILEDNFVFKKDSRKYLVYDDIHMKDLYQVEMLMNYLSDSILIIHESISTGAETGLFLSEPTSLQKTCLIIPDSMAVEEEKLGQFLNLAFNKNQEQLNIIDFYPRVEKNIISENVRRWHTYFYNDKIGENLGCKIMQFINDINCMDEIKFTKNMDKVKEGFIHYKVKDKKLEIIAQPRVLMICIASLFNISEIEKDIFGGNKRTLKEYVQDIKKYLEMIFINTIEEKSGAEISTCSIKAKISIRGVYIGEIIGMCLYLFQAAGFILIEKDKEYSLNKNVTIQRRILSDAANEDSFFYKKYSSCIQKTIDVQIG